MEDLNKAISLIKRWEGLRLTAYQDIVGIWTIGYGSTAGVTEGMVIKEWQADTMLTNDVKNLCTKILGVVKVPINNNQICALIDFCYNLGFGAFYHSDLLTLLNGGSDTITVAEQFLRWDHAGGAVVEALTKRRKEEASLFIAKST